jgi:hypothetical protein
MLGAQKAKFAFLPVYNWQTSNRQQMKVLMKRVSLLFLAILLSACSSPRTLAASPVPTTPTVEQTPIGLVEMGNEITASPVVEVTINVAPTEGSEAVGYLSELQINISDEVGAFSYLGVNLSSTHFIYQ